MRVAGASGVVPSGEVPHAPCRAPPRARSGWLLIQLLNLSNYKDFIYCTYIYIYLVRRTVLRRALLPFLGWDRRGADVDRAFRVAPRHAPLPNRLMIVSSRGLRDASRSRARSCRSLYTQVWTNVFSPPSSLVRQAARGENCSRAVRYHHGGVTHLRDASADPIIAHIHLPPWHHTCSNLPKL
jgi:hypothetical protein